MKAQPNNIDPISPRDVKNSMSYFHADDIRKEGLSPFQSIGSLSGVRRNAGSTRRTHSAMSAYAATPILLNKAETGLSIEQHRPLQETLSSVGAGFVTGLATLHTQTSNVFQTVRRSTSDLYSSIRRQPAVLLSFVPLLVGGIVTYAFLSIIEPHSSTASDSSNQSLVGNDSNGFINGLNGSKSSKQGWSTMTNSSSSTTDGSTASAPTTTTGEPGRGSLSTNLPAGGTTDYLPGGIPGVTQPITTTIPGTTTTIDDKPALITDPTSITLN